MTPLVLDFETYYDKDYSLLKMPTVQYVRDRRFQVLGCAVRLGSRPARYLRGAALRDFLARVPWDRIQLVAHNAAFDGLVLTEHFGYRPGAYACTMLMLRYLISQGEIDAEMRTNLKDAGSLVRMQKGDLEEATQAGRLDEYAAQDAEICHALYEKYWAAVPAFEQEVIDTHVRMATEPALCLDRARLQAMADADTALEKLFPLVRKDDYFAAALDKLGVSPEYKVTPKGTHKLATAKTDGWLKRLLSHANPKVRTLAEIRQKASSTIERTRSQRFLDCGSPLPVPLLYMGAHTGRASGLDKLNLQNLKRDGDLRGAIVAPEGHKLVIVDSSQIEVRVLAWLAQEERLLEVFRAGADPYVAFAASALYHCEPEAVTKDQRQVAKAAVLALGFCQGAGGFMGYCENFGIRMEAEEAERVVQAYRGAYPEISRVYWPAVEREVRQRGRLRLPSGREVVYHDLRLGNDGMEWLRPSIFRKAVSEGHIPLWRGTMVNNAVQATARDVVFHQTLRLVRAGWRVALMVHDEAVLAVPDAKVRDAVRACEVSFGSAPQWAPGLPVKGEVAVSERYVK